MKYLAPLAAALAAGCGNIPQDPDGTLDRVRAERSFKVGIIAAGPQPVALDRAQALIDAVGRETGAEPQFESGASEPLLAKLEEGELDLVVGELSPASPWARHVTILPPLGEQVSRDGHVHVAAMARNGENAWISLLHREARKVASQP